MNRPLFKKEWLAFLEKACNEFDWESARQPQREWVGLTYDDLPEQYKNDSVFVTGWLWAEAKLKEKNT